MSNQWASQQNPVIKPTNLNIHIKKDQILEGLQPDIQRKETKHSYVQVGHRDWPVTVKLEQKTKIKMRIDKSLSLKLMNDSMLISKKKKKKKREKEKK